MFKLIEGDDGLITVNASRHWSVDELRRFWAEAELMITRIRQRHARVIVRIDASDGTIVAADGGLDYRRNPPWNRSIIGQDCLCIHRIG